jgi:hypothetical protein
MLIIPVLMIMAADAVAMLWRYFKRTPPRRFDLAARAGLAGLVAISIGYLGYQSARFDVYQTMPDGREYARQWIVSTVPAETHIAAESYAPFIDPQNYRVDYFNGLKSNVPEWYAAQGYDLLVFSSGAYQRFYQNPELYPAEIAQYEALFSRFPLVAEFNQNDTTIRILKVKP